MSTNKTYQLFLPVYKQGDDLHHCLNATLNDPSKAFESLSAQYEEAAKICKEVAELAKTTQLKVAGDTHLILITGSVDSLKTFTHLSDFDEELDEGTEYES